MRSLRLSCFMISARTALPGASLHWSTLPRGTCKRRFETSFQVPLADLCLDIFNCLHSRYNGKRRKCETHFARSHRVIIGRG